MEPSDSENVMLKDIILIIIAASSLASLVISSAVIYFVYRIIKWYRSVPQ